MLPTPPFRRAVPEKCTPSNKLPPYFWGGIEYKRTFQKNKKQKENADTAKGTQAKYTEKHKHGEESNTRMEKKPDNHSEVLKILKLAKFVHPQRGRDRDAISPTPPTIFSPNRPVSLCVRKLCTANLPES